MIFIGIGVVLAGFGPSPAVQTQDWREDVDVLVEAVERIHPDPFRSVSQDAWYEEAGRLRERMPELEPHQAALGLQRLLALVGDGHTEPAATHASVNGPWLPLLLRRFSDGWFVRTGHLDYADLFGRRIVSIAGMPIEEVAARVRPFVAADNGLGALDGMGNSMRNPAILHAAGVTPSRLDRVEFVAEDADGETVVVEVVAGGDAWVTGEWADSDVGAIEPKPLYRQMDGNYSFTHLEEEDLVYIYFDKVRDEGPETIEQFFGRAFDFVRDNDVERLVLDIRENSGGNLDLSFPVLHGILRSSVNRPGQLFVIIGRDTYSAAMYLAVMLERHTNALFVGEPTGSRTSFFGDTVELTLPRSGLAVEISELYWQPSDPRDRRPWITPDLPAPLHSEDFFARRDPALEAILAFTPSPELIEDFGPTVHRWQRPNQGHDSFWPGVVQPVESD